MGLSDPFQKYLHNLALFGLLDSKPCMLGCLVAGILSYSGDHHAYSMQSGKQSEIVRSSQPFRGVRVVKCRVDGVVMQRWEEGEEW